MPMSYGFAQLITELKSARAGVKNCKAVLIDGQYSVSISAIHFSNKQGQTGICEVGYLNETLTPEECQGLYQTLSKALKADAFVKAVKEGMLYAEQFTRLSL